MALTHTIKIILRFCLIIFGMVSVKAYAIDDINIDALCQGYFPDGAVSNNSNDGQITFNWNAYINNNPDNQLAALTVISNANANPKSCDSDVCEPSNSVAQQYPVNSFPSFNPLFDNIGQNNEKIQIGGSRTMYDEVYASGPNSSITVLNASNGTNEYKIKSLTLGHKTTLKLVSGIYWIESLYMPSNEVKIRIIGAGDVYFYIKNSATFSDKVKINTNNNDNNPNMMIYGYSLLNFNGANSRVNAFVYANDSLSFGSDHIINGAVSGANVSLGSNTKINYPCDAVPQAPIANNFLIEHDGEVQLGELEPVTIYACKDSLCSEYYSSSDGYLGQSVTLDSGNDIPQTITIGAGGQSSEATFSHNGSGRLSLVDNANSVESYLCTNSNVGSVSNSTTACDFIEPKPLTATSFLIEHDGSGATCGAEPVTIRACTDENCTDFFDGNDDYVGQTVTLNTGNGQSQSVVITESGQSEEVTFYGDGEVRLSLEISDDQSYLCDNTQNQDGYNSDLACDISFNESEDGDSCKIDAEEFCSAYFTSGVVSQSDINMLYNAQIKQGAHSPVLTATSVNFDSNSSMFSCESAHCNASGYPRTTYDVGTFKTTNATIEECIDGKGQWNCGGEFKFDDVTLSATEYKHLNVHQNAILNIGSGGSVAKEYRIKKLTLGYLSTINLSPGSYWIEELNINTNNRVTINTLGSGDVKIFINNEVSFQYRSEINQTGSENMLIYGFEKLTFSNETKVNAFIYSKKDISLGYQADISGAVSGQSVSLANSAQVTFECEALPEEEPIDLPADICTAYFVDGITSHSNSGLITLPYGSRVLNSPDSVLESPSVINSSISPFKYFYDDSCGSEVCSASGAPTNVLDFGTFRTSVSSIDWSENGANKVIGDNDDYQFDSVTIQTGKAASFDARHQIYQMNNLTLNDGSILTFTAGEYWIDTLTLGNNSQIIIDEHAYIFVNSDLTLPSSTQLTNTSSISTNLLLYTYGNLFIETSESYPINGLLYAQGNIAIDSDVQITGGVLGQDTTLDYDERSIFGIPVPVYTSTAEIFYDCEVFISPEQNKFLIEHDGSGITCASEPFTIRACSDDLCNNFNTDFDPTSVTLTLDGQVEKTLNINSEGVVIDSYNFTSVATTRLGLHSLEPLCFNSATGEKNSTTACDATFTDSGFLIDISPNKSCGTQDVTIQAVQSSPANSGALACVGALQGIKAIGLKMSYSGAKSAQIHTEHCDGASCEISANQAYQQFILSFDENSSTAILRDFSIFDAGDITLEAFYEETSGELDGLRLEGVGTATIYPAMFAITASNDDGILDGNDLDESETTQKAGEKFTLNIAAQCDDQYSTLNPNYSPKTDNSLQITVQRISPDNSEGYEGILTAFGDASMSSVSSVNWATSGISIPADSVVNGIASSDNHIQDTANYSEVGIIKIYARDTDYVIEPDIANITGESENIGRFTPAYFVQEIQTEGAFISGCSTSGADPFVYFGQEDFTNPDTTIHNGMMFGPAPEVYITAYNASGSITHNYFGDYRKLEASDVFESLELNDENLENSVGVTVEDKTNFGVDSTLLTLEAKMYEGFFSEFEEDEDGNEKGSGMFIYTFNLDDRFIYDRTTNSLVAPIKSDMLFTINPFSDSDTIQANSSLSLEPTAIDVLFARIRLKDSFGIERQRLNQELELEVFDGALFKRHTLDDCSPYSATNFEIENGTLNSENFQIIDSSSALTFAEGNQSSAGLMVAPNKTGGSGTLKINYLAPTWFKYDWGGGNSLSDDPSATATYGIFNKPSKRIITEQEVFQ